MVAPRLLVPFLWMAFIWWLSALPSTAFDDLAIHPPDYAAHAAEYGVLALAWVWALSPLANGELLWAFGLTTAYSLIDEWHQRAVPGRESSFGDLGFDLLGVALVLLAVALARRLRLGATLTEPR